MNQAFPFWKHALFSDKKGQIFGSHGRKLVWRQKGKAYEARNLRPPKDNFTVWGCIRESGVDLLENIEIMNSKGI